jgi:hypothetical protein
MKELSGMMRDALDSPLSVAVAHTASAVVANRVIDALRYQVRDTVWDRVGWALGDVVGAVVRDEVERIQ